MVAKMQLLLQTGVYHKSLDGLTEADWKLLEGIGYGNLFSIFSAYGEPDIVFELAWRDNDFLEGLDYEKQEEFFEDGIMDVYLSRTHKTRVVWTSGPGRFSFLETNAETVCRRLCDTANILLKENVSDR